MFDENSKFDVYSGRISTKRLYPFVVLPRFLKIQFQNLFYHHMNPRRHSFLLISSNAELKEKTNKRT